MYIYVYMYIYIYTHTCMLCVYVLGMCQSACMHPCVTDDRDRKIYICKILRNNSRDTRLCRQL